MDAFRAQLDELMGKDRNLLPHEKNGKGQHFSDKDICKYYICGFCPSELFTNTKSDLGPCTQVHDDQCREQFLAEKNKGDYPFEADWIHYLERLIIDLDRKIKKAHDRLDTQDALPEVPPENQAQLESITEQIQTLLGKMEQLGEEGKVDESQALMRVVDRLKAEKEILLRGGIANLAANAGLGTLGGLTMGQEKKMRVCETCGAFLVVGDTEKRMASHLEGKQHQGYAKIRQAIEDFRKKREEDHAKRRSSSGGGQWERGDARERERDRGDRGDRDRERDRDHRDRDRDRHRDRPYPDPRREYRERDRDRERGDRDRERGDRDRERDRGDRDRDRERERDRGDRSRRDDRR